MSLRPGPPQPDTIRLGHKVFGMFGTPLFQRAHTDQAPVMLVSMGEREVSMPLRSLAREFGITDDSADGCMLKLIAEALEYVSILRIGDPLPAEILTGAASWEPSAQDVRIANARLQIELLTWLRRDAGGAPVQITPEKLAGGEVNAATRELVQTALGRAAEALGMTSAGEVVGRIEELAKELAYIEALRTGLLGRIEAMGTKLQVISHRQGSEGARSDTLTRVRQLSAIALKQISQRFEEQDGQVSEVMSALRQIESHRTYIRANRDWLHRSRLGWDPILVEWNSTDPAGDEPIRGLLERTYHFLAPRYMPLTEWVSFARPDRQAKARTMVW